MDHVLSQKRIAITESAKSVYDALSSARQRKEFQRLENCWGEQQLHKSGELHCFADLSTIRFVLNDLEHHKFISRQSVEENRARPVHLVVTCAVALFESETHHTKHFRQTQSRVDCQEFSANKNSVLASSESSALHFLVSPAKRRRDLSEEEDTLKLNSSRVGMSRASKL